MFKFLTLTVDRNFDKYKFHCNEKNYETSIQYTSHSQHGLQHFLTDPQKKPAFLNTT